MSNLMFLLSLNCDCIRNVILIRVRVRELPLQLSFAVGTSYRFSPSYRKRLLESGFGDGTFWGNTFISGGVGFQFLSGSGRSMGA